MFDLAQGDEVLISVRAPGGSSLAAVEATPAALVGDHGQPANGPGKPLFLYVGTVGGAQAGGHIALHVTDGNRLALRSLLGQPVDQTFTYGYGTIFLLWQGKVPTIIAPSQLKAGDRITVRIRAPRFSTLAQVEATPAGARGRPRAGRPVPSAPSVLRALRTPDTAHERLRSREARTRRPAARWANGAANPASRIP